MVLDPSVFAEEGLPLIATVASRVFSRLLELEDTVILFDETEALMHTRTDAAGSFEHKFLTTSLLPKLQELADRAACLFFVATNHFETIDRAVSDRGASTSGSTSCRRPMRRSCAWPRAPGRRGLPAGGGRPAPPALPRESSPASRNEMLSLCEELRRRPEHAEHILRQFRAELVDDDSFVEGDALSVL